MKKFFYILNKFTCKHFTYFVLAVFAINLLLFFIPFSFQDMGNLGYFPSRYEYYNYLHSLNTITSLSPTPLWAIPYIINLVLHVTSLPFCIILLISAVQKKEQVINFSSIILGILFLTILISWHFFSTNAIYPLFTILMSLITIQLILHFIASIYFKRHPEYVPEPKKDKEPKPKKLSDKERIALLEKQVSDLTQKSDK